MADQTGAMIALMIPPVIADQIKLSMDGALPTEEMHITLAYLGETQDLPEDGRGKALEVVKAVAAQKPISGTINGSGRFVNADTGQDAIYLNFDAPELPDLRAKIIDQLKQAGLPAVENHGFSPHITLAYVDPGMDMPKIELPGEPVTVAGLTLAWGEEQETVPFGNPEAASSDETPAEDNSASMPAQMGNKAVKAAGDWELDVLGVPFGGPDGGKDSDGQFFSARTNIHRESYPTIPAVYYHGLSPEGRPMGEPEIIGKAQYLRVGQEGHWWHVILDKSSEFAKRIWDSAQKGTARASSGTIDYLARLLVNGVKRMYDKLVAGEIINWPVAELSLIDADGKRQPANNYAVALPSAKSVFERAGLNLPDIKPETGSDDQGEESRSEGTAKGKSKQGVLEMDEKDLLKLLDERDARRAAEEKAKADRETELQARVAAAVKAEKEKWDAEAAKSRRLPLGMPLVAQFAATRKYDNLSTADLALVIDAQHGLHAASANTSHQMPDVSAAAIEALALKVARIENDKVSGDTAGYAKSALKARLGSELTDEAIKAATDPNYVYTAIGTEWVGTAYSNQIWEAIRAVAKIVARIPSDVIPDGYSSETVPIESSDPTWYKVPEVSAADGTMKVPAATVTASQVATANKNITVAKMGARDMYSGELTEDSLIAFAPQLRKQLEISGAEMMEYIVIDGDTATSSNINDIGGTTYSGAATSLFLLTNGFRKSALVTTTTQSRSAGGSFAAEDFLLTGKLLGANGLGMSDPTKCAFIVDPNVWFATPQLPEAKDKNQNVFVVEGGFVTRAYLIEVIPSWFMHKNSASRKANTAGKVDQDTAGNNAYGGIVGVRWDQWKLKYKRRMSMEVTRFANSDSWEIVALTRWGLGQRDTVASAETYYVGV
jgi:2'-5' RNA ligase